MHTVTVMVRVGGKNNAERVTIIGDAISQPVIASIVLTFFFVEAMEASVEVALGIN